MNTSKYDGIVSALLLAKHRTGASFQAIADRTGISVSTLTRRLDRPEDFTVYELGTLARTLGIPMDDMRAAIVRACS